MPLTTEEETPKLDSAAPSNDNIDAELALLRPRMRDLDVEESTMCTWTPGWSEHPLSVLGQPVTTYRTVMHYDQAWYESRVVELIKEAEFDLLVDIGAAFGYISCLSKATRPEIPVVAIEADPIRFGLLLSNTAPYKQITPVYGMAGHYQLKINKPSRMCDPRIKVGVEVKRSYSVSELLALYPAATSPLVKIDIEGGEWEIVRQSLQLLSDPGIKWIIEWHPWSQQPAKHAIDLFEKAGRKAELVGDDPAKINQIYVI